MENFIILISVFAVIIVTGYCFKLYFDRGHIDERIVNIDNKPVLYTSAWYKSKVVYHCYNYFPVSRGTRIQNKYEAQKVINSFKLAKKQLK